jgi:hypothetical protein
MLLPHRLEIRSSSHLVLALSFLHVAALGSLLSLHLPAWLKMALAVTIVALLAMALRRHALCQASSSIRGLVLKDDGTVEGQRNDGSRFDARVSGQTTALSWLVVILLETPGTRRLHPLVILPDALPAEDGRILRAWLRWKIS